MTSRDEGYADRHRDAVRNVVGGGPGNGYSLCPDDRSLRPDLVGTVLELPPGRWWSDDGWLRMEIVQVGDPNQRGLPEGWVWVAGDMHVDGRPYDWCTVPVRIDALPSPVPPGRSL